MRHLVFALLALAGSIFALTTGTHGF